MPINFETATGYYDGEGIFHANTGLMPSPVKSWAYTVPTNPEKSLPFIDYEPGFQYTGTTLADAWHDSEQWVRTTGYKIQDMTVDYAGDFTGRVLGAAAGSLAMTTIAPIALILGGAYIFRKPLGKLIK